VGGHEGRVAGAGKSPARAQGGASRRWEYGQGDDLVEAAQAENVRTEPARLKQQQVSSFRRAKAEA
jgi:hypothetical protein